MDPIIETFCWTGRLFWLSKCRRSCLNLRWWKLTLRVHMSQRRSLLQLTLMQNTHSHVITSNISACGAKTRCNNKAWPNSTQSTLQSRVLSRMSTVFSPHLSPCEPRSVGGIKNRGSLNGIIQLWWLWKYTFESIFSFMGGGRHLRVNMRELVSVFDYFQHL